MPDRTEEVLHALGESRDLLAVVDGHPVYRYAYPHQRHHPNHPHGHRHYSRAGREHPAKHMQWRRTLAEPANLLVLCDLSDVATRLVIGDWRGAPAASPRHTLHGDFSMAEIYLVLSVWFDNVFEEQAFFPTLVAEAAAHTSTRSDQPSVAHPNHASRVPFEAQGAPKPNVAPPEPLPPYGSVAYIDGLRKEAPTFELLLVRAAIVVDCSMDVGYFPVTPPSMRFLDLRKVHPAADQAPHAGSGYYRRGGAANVQQGASGSGPFPTAWVHRFLPVAEVAVTNVIVHLRGNATTVQLAASVGGAVSVTDVRGPKRIEVLYAATPEEEWHSEDMLFRAGKGPAPPRGRPAANPRSASPGPDSGCTPRRYVAADFDFGYNLVPTSVDRVTQGPLQLALLRSLLSNWSTVIVCTDHVDLSMNNAEMFFLLCDFFGSYFWTEHYGHPGLAAYANLPPPMIPYGGSDTRLYFSRPLVVVSDVSEPTVEAGTNKPVRDRASAAPPKALLFDTRRGVYYRYIADGNGSRRMDFNLFDVAAVIVVDARKAARARGLRGRAGSGKGVRTLVEHFDLFFSREFNAEKNHVDLSLSTKVDEMLDDSARGGAEYDAGAESGAPYGSSVDWDSGRLDLVPVSIPRPTCIIPHQQHRRAAGTAVGDVGGAGDHQGDSVVSSYEDMLLIADLWSQFATDPDPAAAAAAAQQVSSPMEAKRSTASPDLYYSAYGSGGEGPFHDTNPMHGGNHHASVRGRTGSVSSTGSVGQAADAVLEKPSIFAIVKLSARKLILVDNVLGLHLPLLQVRHN